MPTEVLFISSFIAMFILGWNIGDSMYQKQWQKMFLLIAAVLIYIVLRYK